MNRQTSKIHFTWTLQISKVNLCICFAYWLSTLHSTFRVLKSVFLKTLTVTRAHLLYALSDKAFCLVHYPQRKSLLCPSVPKAALIVPRLNLSNAFNKRISETALTAPLLSSFNIKLVKVNIFQKEGLKRFRWGLAMRKSLGWRVTDGTRSQIPKDFSIFFSLMRSGIHFSYFVSYSEIF